MVISPQIIFYLLISIILFNFIKDYFLDYLNSKFFDKKIPENLSDIYDKEKYQKSQDYKKTLYKFGKISKAYSLTILLLFFFLDGFLLVDNFARSLFESELLISLSFFGIIFFGSDILNLPFSLYSIFIIEEKFGFNKTTFRIYFFDKIKSWFITILFGGGILSFIIFQFETVGKDFWIVAWVFITTISVLINGFYAQIIVPLFNKQTKLEEGNLKNDIEKYSLLGETRDDAAGEAFDKGARILGLGYPGGPAIEKKAIHGNPNKYHFPRILLGKDSLDFSFSGLKTSLLYFMDDFKKTKIKSLSDVIASYQQAIVETLVEKTRRAMVHTGTNRCIIAGGVAANQCLRERLELVLPEKDILFPDFSLCTDNAAMISYLGHLKFQSKIFKEINFSVIPNLKLV